MNIKSKIFTVLILLFTTISYASIDKPQTRDEFEQKVEQQQAKIKELEMIISEQKKQILDLKWQIDHLEYGREPNETTEIKKKNAENEKLQNLIKTQKAEIAQLKELCRKAGIDIEAAKHDRAETKSYKIAKTEDISIKAMSKPLSAYSLSELTNLPMNIRKEYRVVVPSNILKEELKNILMKVVKDKTSENPDIDAVTVFAYGKGDDIDGAYTFGKVIWCPNGKWGDVNERIASTNDRSSYKYVFDIANWLKEKAISEKESKIKTKKIKRHIQVLADRYTDGKISFGFYTYDSKGATSWIGSGVLKLYIKDNAGKVIKIWEKRMLHPKTSGDIYMGSAIHSVRSMDAEYKADDGDTYFEKGISLERLLEW